MWEGFIFLLARACLPLIKFVLTPPEPLPSLRLVLAFMLSSWQHLRNSFPFSLQTTTRTFSKIRWTLSPRYPKFVKEQIFKVNQLEVCEWSSFQLRLKCKGCLDPLSEWSSWRKLEGEVRLFRLIAIHLFKFWVLRKVCGKFRTDLCLKFCEFQ